MDNYKLLEKYRKKLSFYFALFVLFSFWWTQFIYQWVSYYRDNSKLEKSLENKLNWIKNVIRNKTSYDDILKSDDKVFEKIIRKTLDNSVIYNNWKLAISFIDNFDKSEHHNDNSYYIFDSYIYMHYKYLYDSNEYDIYLRDKYNIDIYKYLKDYLFFVMFSLPFYVLFYFIGYFFVWKTLNPIKQNISNLEDFTSNINHEIKTPLSEILSSLNLAKKTWDYIDAVDISINSANRINKIIDSLLWILNVYDNSYKRERLNLWDEIKLIVNDVIKSSKRDINLDIDIKDNSLFIKVNKQHLDICISNILKNSIKYSNGIPYLKISLNKWELTIIDNWIWIEENNLKNLFTKFFRENYIEKEGMWLGLSIVKKIVDINKWQISIESEKSVWTTVKIRFA